MTATILILVALFSFAVVLVHIAKAFDYICANWSSPAKVDYTSNYNNYDYKVPRDSAGKRISALFTYTAPIPKPPKATFFGKLDGKEFSIETPEEEKYLDTTGIHL